MMQDRDCGDENDATMSKELVHRASRAWPARLHLNKALYLDGIGAGRRTPEEEAWLQKYLEQLAD